MAAYKTPRGSIPAAKIAPILPWFGMRFRCTDPHSAVGTPCAIGETALAAMG